MKKTTVFTCGVCHKEITQEHEDFTTGYGIDSKHEKICYNCCAEEDKQFMRDNGKITLYLVKRYDNQEPDRFGFHPYNYFVINWPSSLEIKCYYHNKGKHNMAGTRYDVWFKFEGYVWHGVQYGENTQLCHCKKTKQR